MKPPRYAQRFVELGLDPEQVVLVVRVLAEGLSRAAEVMRYTALSAIMRPGPPSWKSPRPRRRW